jgi:long-subunit fatty acid transport protein
MSLRISLFLLFSLPSTLWAQSNSFITPIGGAEGITGNTGIGRYGSSGSVIYNPAGLAGIKSHKVSVSGTAISQNKVTIKDKGLPETSNKYFETTPSQLATIFAEDKFTWGVSLLVPYSMQTELDIKTKDGADTTVTSHYFKAQETLLGPSIGFSLSPKYKIGLSLFAAKADNLVKSSVYVQGVNTLTTYSQKRSAIIAYPILGFLSLESKTFSWGVRCVLPSLQLSGDQEIKLHENGSDELTSKDKLTYKHPTEFGLGLSWIPSPRWKLLVDSSIQSSIKYQEYNSDTFEPTYVDYKDASRVGFGVEYKTSSHDRLTAGILASQSPEKDTSSTFGDYKGYTLGYRSIDKNGVGSSYGIYYLTSANDKDENDEDKDVQTTFKSETIGIFISTSIGFKK